MPTVRKRSTETKTASRRRDRDHDEEDVDVDAETDAEEEAPRPRKSTSASKKSVRSRREEPEDEEEESGEESEEDGEEERPRKARASTKKASRRDEPEPEEDEPEEDERPRRKKKGGSSEGVRSGWAGADETLKAGGGGDRMQPGKDAELIKFLDDAPLVSCRQHWLATEAGGSKRPYVCPGKGCPICALGDDPGPMYGFNVLHLSGSEEPRVRLLQVGTKAYQNLKEVSANKTTGVPVINKGFFSVQKTGTGNKAQTSFRPVKDRDLEDDWEEIFEFFDIEDLDDIIAEADELKYQPDIVKGTPRRQLEEIARYLADD